MIQTKRQDVGEPEINESVKRVRVACEVTELSQQLIKRMCVRNRRKPDSDKDQRKRREQPVVHLLPHPTIWSFRFIHKYTGVPDDTAMLREPKNNGSGQKPQIRLGFSERPQKPLTF